MPSGKRDPLKHLRLGPVLRLSRDLLERRERRRHVDLPALPAPPAGEEWWSSSPVWYPRDTPPRQGNRVDALVDGQAAFRQVFRDMRAAQHSIWLVDWALNPDMELVRGADQATEPPAIGVAGPGYRLIDVLSEMAESVDVRVLVWRGSCFLRPRARHALAAIAQLQKAHPGLRGAVDGHEHFSHCHHQKGVIIDGRIAYLGGLDVTDFDVDRWDTSAHAPRHGLNWHDAYLRIAGPAAADAAHNFRQRWQATTGEELPVPSAFPAAEGTTAVQIVRTIPATTYPFAPAGEFGIGWAYQQALRAAEHAIYIENQYLWSPMIADELERALRRIADPAFRLTIVLPARPNIGKDDTDHYLKRLDIADAGRGRVHAFTLYTAERTTGGDWRYKPIYVHAKIAVVDDHWLTIGSANLNGRGMISDSEINAHLLDAPLAGALRCHLWAEHLGVDAASLASLPVPHAVDHLLVPTAQRNWSVLRARGGPLPSALVPYQQGHMPRDLSLGELEAMLLDR